MILFSYKGRDAQGAETRGTVQAQDKMDALEKLKLLEAQGISNISIESAQQDVNPPIQQPTGGQTIIVQNIGPQQKHGLPAFLSFVCPGLGQFIKGRVLKGIMFFTLFLISIPLCIILVGIPMLFVVWFWSVADAYNNA